MPSQRLTVSIPQPCHKAWHTMTPQGQGRIFGRFRKDQIENELVTAASAIQKRLICRVLILALGLSIWLSAMTVEAKDSQPPYTFLAFLATETASTDSIKVLKGTVLDSASKEPMPGVSLYWKGTSIGVSTNAEGKFNLVVPENQIPIPQILVVTYIGYLKQEISLEDLLTNQNPVIGLSPDLISRVEIVVTAICAEKPGFKKVLSSPKKKE